MMSPFSEVLARESASLAQVTDKATLARWRRHVVDELMTPGSPYALALRPTGDVADRAGFLDRWRSLIAEAVDRLPPCPDPREPRGFAAQSRRRGVDAQEAALLILAALHGGAQLSQVAQDPRPLNAALDLALGPFTGPGGHRPDNDEEIG